MSLREAKKFITGDEAYIVPDINHKKNGSSSSEEEDELNKAPSLTVFFKQSEQGKLNQLYKAMITLIQISNEEIMEKEQTVFGEELDNLDESTIINIPDI